MPMRMHSPSANGRLPEPQPRPRASKLEPGPNAPAGARRRSARAIAKPPTIAKAIAATEPAPSAIVAFAMRVAYALERRLTSSSDAAPQNDAPIAPAAAQCTGPVRYCRYAETATKPDATSSGPARRNCHVKRNASSSPTREWPNVRSRYVCVPPDSGHSAPSSAHTIESTKQSAAAHAYPMSACGPAGVTLSSRNGSVMNGPVPNIFSMFSVKTSRKPSFGRSSSAMVGLESRTRVRGSARHQLPPGQREHGAGLGKRSYLNEETAGSDGPWRR